MKTTRDYSWQAYIILDFDSKKPTKAAVAPGVSAKSASATIKRTKNPAWKDYVTFVSYNPYGITKQNQAQII